MAGNDDRVLMAHGGGGELMQSFIREHIVSRLGNEFLEPLSDSANLPVTEGRICVTTDSYVIQPLFFPGGDIGKLAVCGTVNDISVAGGRPIGLTLGLIIEEGLEFCVLDSILDSLSEAARTAGVPVVTGDTKVIERSRGDGLMINTAGIGVMYPGVNLDTGRIVEGDVVMVSGNIAEHGLAVMAVREELGFSSELRSDAAALNGLIGEIIEAGIDVKFMRDPTRGGLAGVLADLCEATGMTVEVDESSVPLSSAARGLSEVLGLDPFSVANEGKFVAVVSAGEAERLVEICSGHELGRGAAVIGKFVGKEPGIVEVITRAGGRRVLQRPYGEDLPRIC